jgi:prepilin-type N-terminal cleavage/methylation domain-containing protein
MRPDGGSAVVHEDADSGFTLIEMLFTMALAAILFTLAVGGWRQYQRAQELGGSERDLVSFLRNAQADAVDEETSFKATFATDGRSVALARCTIVSGSCSWSQIALLAPNGSTVTYSSPAFTQSDGSTQRWILFSPRGAATPGTVAVVRQGSSKTYTVTVEGLTGRVSG